MPNPTTPEGMEMPPLPRYAFRWDGTYELHTSGNWVRYEDALAAVAADRQRREVDAKRYDWLRNFRNFAQVDAMLDTIQYNTLDDAVDIAMALQDQGADHG